MLDFDILKSMQRFQECNPKSRASYKNQGKRKCEKYEKILSLVIFNFL